MMDARSYTLNALMRAGRAPANWLAVVERRSAWVMNLDRLSRRLTDLVLAPPPTLLSVPIWGNTLTELTQAADPEIEPNQDGRSASRKRTRGGPEAPMGSPYRRSLAGGSDGSSTAAAAPQPPAQMTSARPQIAPLTQRVHRKGGPSPAAKTVTGDFLNRWVPAGQNGHNANSRSVGRHSSTRKILDLARLPRSKPLPVTAESWSTLLARQTGRRLIAQLTDQSPTQIIAQQDTATSATAVASNPQGNKEVGGRVAAHPRPNMTLTETTLVRQWRKPLIGPAVPRTLLAVLAGAELDTSLSTIKQEPTANPNVGQPSVKTETASNSMQPAPAIRQNGAVRAPVVGPAAGNTTAMLLPHSSAPDDFSAASWLGSPALPAPKPAENGRAHTSRKKESPDHQAEPGEDLIELAESVKRILDEEARRFGIDV